MGIERITIMRVVRAANVSVFRNTVNKMIEEKPFVAGECMVLEIARAAAVALGLSRDVVTLVPLHSKWTSAQFTHEVLTPMPPPPKGVKKQPPVLTRTKYMVVKASAKIRAYREFLVTHEEESDMEGEVMVAEHQRPIVTDPPSDNNNSLLSSSEQQRRRQEHRREMERKMKEVKMTRRTR